MVFSSIEFLFAFLPLFLLCQVILPAKNLTIVVFSAAFYFVGEGWYSAVVLVSLIFNYAFGISIELCKTPRMRKLVVAAAVSSNVLLLVVFKYLNLILSTLVGGAAAPWGEPIHLPLGVSFFTFHSMSYIIDVYRREAKAERSLINLAVYILMFPQLIAGPILRFSNISSQLRSRVISARHIYNGVGYFVIGLGQKVLIADTLSGIADPLFSNTQNLSTGSAWLAVISYTLQIFFDFAGYSNMAIGLGMLCGFTFPINFNYPYISKSVGEFWRRWHITLSSWFRDYLYKPLGGNRHGAWNTYRNLFIVFLLCGLWHGAAWNFALWGLYHGLLLVVERLGFSRILAKLPVLAGHAYTLLAVMLGWVLFRVDNLDQALAVYRAMVVPTGTTAESLAGILNGERLVTLAAAFVLSTPVLIRVLGPVIALPRLSPWQDGSSSVRTVPAVVIGLLIFGLSAIKIFTGAYSPFIYYRF